jgi:hypothetical protein
MATPVTSSDVAILLQRELTEAEEAAVELYIEMAEGEIEAYLGRPIKPTAFEEEGYFPNADGVIYLRNTPVISVEALSVNGETLAPTSALTVTSYGLENAWGLMYDYIPYVDREVNPQDYYGATATVSYTAGLDYPAGIRALVLSSVLKRFQADATNNANVAAGTAGTKRIKAEDFEQEWFNTTVVMSGTSGLSMFASDADFNSIRRYKRLMVA